MIRKIVTYIVNNCQLKSGSLKYSFMVMMQMGLKFIKEKNEQKERKTCNFDYLKFLHITQPFFKARLPQLDIDRLFSLSLLNVEDSWFKSLVPNSTSLLKSIPLILFLLCSSILKVKKKYYSAFWIYLI